MKKQTKALIGVIAATSLTVAAISTLFSGNPMADATRASFNGIGNIIKNATEAAPFTVVELVPDEKMAKFGYLIEGSEPEDWRKELAKLDTKQARVDYMTNLRTKLNSILATDRTKPLTYTDYKETYSLDDVNSADEAKYSSMELNNPVKLVKGTNGYKMVASPGASFNLNVSYNEKEDGDYDENVISYAFVKEINGRYAVKFKAVDTNELTGKKLYKAKQELEIRNMEEVKILGGNRYIYRMEKNATGPQAAYEFAFSNKKYNDYIIDDAYNYALVSFEAVDETTLTVEDKLKNIYYEVEEIEDFFPTKDAEYKGILDEKEPYKNVGSGKGHYEMTADESYVFVGKGKGNMKLVEASGGQLDHDVELKTVFYTGGFKNNNWFENGVFLKNFTDGNYLSSGDADYNNARMKFKVITLTPAALNAELAANSGYLSQAGLFYISASSSLTNASGLSNYASGNDIDNNVLNKIKDEVKSKKLPVLVEYANGLYDSAANMKALVNELVKDKTTLDKDNDGHFVDKSVYVIGKDNGAEAPYIVKQFATAFINKTTSTDTEFVTEAKNKGFGEIADSIIEENNIIEKGIEGTTDNTEKFKLEISKARALEYIISLNMKRKKTTDDEIKILDIEPARVMKERAYPSPSAIMTEDELKTRMNGKLSTWFSGSPVTSSSVTVPTTEFIGRTEDLSTYDVIYMGLDISNFNTRIDASGKEYTTYNDSNMDGLIYSNIGDLSYSRATGTYVDINKAYKTKKEPEKGAGIYSSTAGMFDRDYHKTGVKHNNLEAYKDADDQVDGIKINYNKELEEAASGSAILNEYLEDEGQPVGLPTRGSIKAIVNDTLSYRFSGNDITKEKLDKLKEYISSGYPIVFASDFVKTSGTALSVNEDRIDNCSKMYELVKFAIEFDRANPAYKNVIFEKEDGKLEAEELKNLVDNINLPKPSIHIIQSKAYEKDADNQNSEYTRIDDRTLEIDFKILNKGVEGDKAKFKVSLFIDKNADGKFSGKKEEVDRTYYTLSRDGVIQTGEVTASNSAGYKINYKLPKNYVGVIPWRLKVEQAGTGTIKKYATEIGFGYIKNEDTKKQKIKILQIMSAGYGNTGKEPTEEERKKYTYKYNPKYNWHIDDGAYVRTFGGDLRKEDVINSTTGQPEKDENGNVKQKYIWGWNTNNNFNMETDTDFNRLLNLVKDFDIQITAIDGTEFAEEYKKFKEAPENAGKRPEDFFEVNGYNMVVMGFGDCYAIHNTYNCLDAVQGFINAGKPILFTHDCTSYINCRAISPWGYDFNRMVRDQAGLDRYGVLTNWALRLGVESDKNSSTSISKDIYPTLAKNLNNNINSGDLFNLAQTRAIAKSKDIAYVPKSNKTKIAIEAQGLTNGALAKGGLVSAIKPEQRTDGKIVISGPSIIKETNKFHTTPVLKQLFPHKWQDTSTFSTNIIKQVNRGQITTYPFKIEKQIYISDTHYQPYQLDLNEDLDKDGESDIIVWYTLGLADYAENNEKMMGNMYRLSPKDVRNNYYIYTKGNITYSGVGHSKVTKDDERKLYINTLVAAYKSAAVAPDVIFKESEKPDSAEKSVSYVSYDVLADATNNGSIEDKVRAYFIPTDENDLIRNIKEDETRILVSVASLGAVSSGFIKPEYDIFKADGTNTKITDKARDKEGNEFFVLEKGKVYYLEIPVSELGEKNKLELNVTARTRFTKSYKVATGTAPVYDYSPMGTSTYIIQKRGLFDLD